MKVDRFVQHDMDRALMALSNFDHGSNTMDDTESMVHVKRRNAELHGTTIRLQIRLCLARLGDAEPTLYSIVYRKSF